MFFIDTRNSGIHTDAASAILRGLAPDGGLFLPDEIPAISAEEIAGMTVLPYEEIASCVLGRFLPGFDTAELLGFARAAYASFDDRRIVPLNPLGDGISLLELYHGPTCAFKDLALQMLPYLMASSVKKCGEDHTVAILVATSGDTGKAALAGFADVPGTMIGVFYPDGGVSDIQRAQMVTQEGENVRVMAVEGNFDDAQTGVKRIFSDAALCERLRSAGVVLSSANSINWGRLAPQIAYYYSAYAQLLASGAVRAGEKVDFAVPTGNFGDILAGYYAKKSGLPVGNLICASNSNNVLTDFLHSGVYDRERPFLLTMSPSMDILISSNLERLLYLLSGDPERVAGWMRALTDAGRYDVGDLREKARDEGFLGYYADEEETARTIRETWEERRRAVDPHTAVGLAAARQYRAETGEKRPCVVLSTASPFKFAGSMLHCLGRDCPKSGFDALYALSDLTGLPVPAPLAALRTKAERFSGTVAPADMASAVEKWLS